MIRWRTAGRGLILGALWLAAACSAPRESIIVDEGMVTVENQTERDWRNVKITVNDHFSGGVAVLLPGGRIAEPLGRFQTAFGQKFDRGRQSVFKVEVTATEQDGKPVSLNWRPPVRP
jgi:hypothetical protein